MTLRCECGGMVKVEDGGKAGDVVTETYRCQSCGRRGTYTNDLLVGETTVSGCLTSR
jgi:hypothetical protein